jgi:Tfp pilus assembly protein PilO
MNDTKLFLILVASGVLAAAGLGFGAWSQAESVEQAMARAAGLRAEVQAAEKQLKKSRQVEDEVLVLRALSEEMKRVLPDEDDVNNLVRTLNQFSEDAKVRISGLKKKNTDVHGARKKAVDFDRVAYTLTLEGDTFQLLSFLDLIEGHSRFMNVPVFRLQAARREEIEETGGAAHSITLDVETYAWEPKKGAKPVRIEGSEAREELLIGAIERRKQQISVDRPSWRGQRGRRDPFVDPRVPASVELESALSVQRQGELVSTLVAAVAEVAAKSQAWRAAENVIVEMTARAEFEAALSRLEGESRLLEGDGSIVYTPARRRLQLEVLEPLAALRAQLDGGAKQRGPTESQLKSLLAEMEAHAIAGRWQAAIDAHDAVSQRIDGLRADPLRGPLVLRMADLAFEARAVVDFDALKLKIGAVVIIEGGTPVATVNGRSVSVGDSISDELVVHSITGDEVEFAFRGVVLARRL